MSIVDIFKSYGFTEKFNGNPSLSFSTYRIVLEEKPENEYILSVYDKDRYVDSITNIPTDNIEEWRVRDLVNSAIDLIILPDKLLGGD